VNIAFEADLLMAQPAGAEGFPAPFGQLKSKDFAY